VSGDTLAARSFGELTAASTLQLTISFTALTEWGKASKAIRK